eukprot:CAMPEP_0198208262 /NCGR_PEP_ID=MMETSP1445-20131203/11646_1 /TAXON_ID=36898 /ORGANISM="Pyramimonas sp., Strain CCMP2087" /LENGTH=152 /DNA_ID=CAMNT_0043881593 /DNA_START=391 /DNA_END=849 /DNA_ORIENTATION=-
MPPSNEPPRPKAALLVVGVLRRRLHHLALELVGDLGALRVADAELPVGGELLLQEGVPLHALLGHHCALGHGNHVNVEVRVLGPQGGGVDVRSAGNLLKNVLAVTQNEPHSSSFGVGHVGGALKVTLRHKLQVAFYANRVTFVDHDPKFVFI